VTCTHSLRYYSKLDTSCSTPISHGSCDTTVSHRHFLWYYSHIQKLHVVLQSPPCGITDTFCVLQSLTDTSCGTSHSQILPVVLQSLTNTPCGNTVTHRYSLWYYSYAQTLPVVPESLTDTSCGTTAMHKHSLWYQSHSQTLSVILK